MYLIVPDGMIKVVWEAYSNLKFTSKYWTTHPINSNLHVFSFNWENAIYRILLDTEKKTCTMSINLDSVLKFNFNVLNMELDQEEVSHKTQALRISVSSIPTSPTSTPQQGTFALYPIEESSPIKQ